VPKGLPQESGKPRLAIQQPTHEKEYSTFSGTIPEGYGKGKVSIEHWGDIDILKWAPNEKKIVVLSGKKKGTYTLKRTDKNNWMIIKHKEGKNMEHYKLVPITRKLKKDAWDDPNVVAELKRDGARYALEVGEDGTKVISVRKSATGKVLDKSANLPQISHEIRSKEYAGTVLDTEIYHDKGHSTVGGIMNSLPDKARATQKIIGPAKYEVFDILKYKGKDVTDKSYVERRALIEKLHQELNIPISQKFEKDKYEKYQELIAKGEEGVVLKYKDSSYYAGDWMKAKRKETAERAIIGFEMVPTTAKQHAGKVGAIKVANYQDGKWVYAGKVASGLTDELRDDITRYPEKYLGKIIEIEGMQIYKGGTKMRQPTLSGMIKSADRYKYEIHEKHPNNQKFVRERWDRIQADMKANQKKSGALFKQEKKDDK
jgi:bifunctional non-homologous end joining protein LigD